MWKALKDLPKGWRLRLCQSSSSSNATESTTNINVSSDPKAVNGVQCEQLDVVARAPEYFFTEKSSINNKIANSNQVSKVVYAPRNTQLNWCEKVFSGRKCGHRHHFCDNFFEFLGLGFVVAAGLKYGRSGYLDNDDKKEGDKKHGFGGVASALLGMACAVPKSGLQRMVLPIGTMPSLSTELAKNTNEAQQSDYEETAASSSSSSSSSSVDEDFMHLQHLASEYAANALNEEAIQLLLENKLKQAVQCLKDASKLGLDKAMFNLGICYELGHGVDQDLPKAHHFYEKAARLGHSTALYNLAVFHLEGKGVPVDEKEGLKCMKKASEKGMKEAQTFLGVHYGQKEDYKNAVDQFKKASKQKHADAEYFLGLCYENGLGVDDDLSKAAELYKKSAKAGNADACYSLALYYENGLGGLVEDKGRAMDLYHKAATAGHPMALKMFEWGLHENTAEPSGASWRKTVPSLKGVGMRVVSSLPDIPSLARRSKDRDNVQKPAMSSSLLDIASFKDLLIDFWKSDLSRNCDKCYLENDAECVSPTDHHSLLVLKTGMV